MKDASSVIGLDSAKNEAVIDVTARTSSLARTRFRLGEVELFWLGTALVTATLASVLAWFLRAWPPHEDEALALFVGRGPLGRVLETVVTQRGGAPLHFVLAWLVVHLGGGLTALRAVSLVFAVASVPLIALLGARLANRSAGVVAALFASASWVMLFHGIYGRMYSLFLFTSVLSFLALLSALERGGRGRFVLWGGSLLLMLASHPYAALVVAAQGLFVLVRRRRLRPALITLAAVGVVGAPFWWGDLVLRDRFDVGVGGGGPRLGSPTSVLHYLWWVAGDFSAGHHAWSGPVLVLAAVGAVMLARRRADSALLTACVVVVPAVAFMLATLHSTASPEARHLIFVLPFFSLALALPLVELARARPPLTWTIALAAAAVLVFGEVRWAHAKTPPLFDGNPAARVHAREAAAAWLASTYRQSDVLLGYEPVFLEAWQMERSFSRHALPRADARLLAAALKDIPEPIGRGVWVFDASDTTNATQRLTIPFALPAPRSAFEGRAYGPYLVIRSRRPLVTRRHYLAVSQRVMRLGVRLKIGDADVNLGALRGAVSRL
jgi:Dolichyl-phosphate-mannose-protein mannosyltransferase